MSNTQISSKAGEQQELKRRASQKRRDSQQAFRNRNTERLREAARLRMQRRRAELKESAEKAVLAREKRREADANHRENIRREKFVRKHGYREYLTSYLPLLNEFNSFRLAGVKIPVSTNKTVPGDQDEDEE
ncbi:hypothetical protein B0H16DRAFT_1688377 [Mycena metata]|uniref:Uncharacterized protein n=1 Tax=Mycena metata TaxID=1033252 RepID=A0AAD7JC46_9AGAR|nr:hypothetical protein B0H16DRAFT_1688377 [Mycena metata]